MVPRPPRATLTAPSFPDSTPFRSRYWPWSSLRIEVNGEITGRVSGAWRADPAEAVLCFAGGPVFAADPAVVSDLVDVPQQPGEIDFPGDRKSTRLNSSHY